MKKVKIGLLGFGNVGGGTYKILTDNRDIIEQRTGLSPEIVRILQRNRKKKRLVEADPELSPALHLVKRVLLLRRKLRIH